MSYYVMKILIRFRHVFRIRLPLPLQKDLMSYFKMEKLETALLRRLVELILLHLYISEVVRNFQKFFKYLEGTQKIEVKNVNN